ncbi:MAG: DNA polymerase III [Clostridia bacterium]|nr:DNA polymerase III [Clostridia bacterium]
MRVVCIDFETANRFAGSICAIGIAVLEDSSVVDTKYWLVKPHADYSYFDPFNVMIHGIDEEAVKDAPEFNDIYEQIKPVLRGAMVSAHNAAFDMSALRHVLDLYEIEYPEIEYVCSYKVALKTWSGLRNYKLNTICQFLNHEFTHHNAQEDAVACSKVLLEALVVKGVSTIEELTSLIGMSHGKLYIGGYNPCSIRSSTKGLDIKDIVPQKNTFDQEHEFYKKKLVFTGMLSAMTRKEAMQKVVDAGGFIGNGVTEDTDFLIMGMQDYSKFADGKESSKTKKAKDLISKGRQLQIIDEVQFTRLL